MNAKRAAPPFEWREDKSGADAAAKALGAVRDDLAARGTKALFVAQRDRVVCEWYAPDWEASKPHYSASLAKALVGGTSLLLVLGDDRLSPDDLAARYVPQWRDDPRRSRITIRHLATHSSGLADAEHDVEATHPTRGWEWHFWARDPDPFTVSRDRTPLRFDPGAGYEYSNPGMAMLAYCVTAALRGAPQPDIRTLLAERAYGPIGLREGDWSIGYRTPYVVDGLTLWANWGGGAFTARAVARIGRLMLRRGDWEGAALLDAARIAAALHHAGTPLPDRNREPHAPASGLCWYTNEDGAWPDVPRDAFAVAGAGQQVLAVVPSLDLIVVRLGQPMSERGTSPFWTPVYEHVFAPAVAALR
jgi:CubicO group peptidase (beta-lactamase class C family)